MPSSAESDFKLDTSYAPATYGLLNPDAQGRWSVLGSGLGVLWTDDGQGLGLIPNAVEDPTQISTLVGLISEYKNMGASATAAFNALQIIYSGDDPETGQLSALPKQDPLLAAADPASAAPSAAQEEIFAAFNDDELVAVGRATPTAMYMRDSGNWQQLPDSDLRFDDTEWLPLDDAGLAKYDAAEKSGVTITRADVESQTPQT